MAVTRIVVIHSYQDNQRCHSLVKSLQAVKYHVSYNRWSWLRENISWIPNKSRTLPESDIYLLILSKASLSSAYWETAAKEALRKDKIVIPILYDLIELPGFLKLIQSLDVTEIDASRIPRRVIAQLDTIATNQIEPPSLDLNPDLNALPTGSKPASIKYLFSLFFCLTMLLLSITGTSDHAGLLLAHQRTGTSLASPTIYAGSTDRTVYALNSRDSTLRWQYWVGGNSEPLNVIMGNEILYVSAGSSGLVYAFRVEDGKKLWQYQFPNEVDTVTVADNIVYAASNTANNLQSGSDFVCALQATSGVLLWCHTIIGSVIKRPTVIKAIVYVATIYGSSSYIYAFHSSNGQQLWSHQLKGGSEGMVIDANVVYVTAANELCAWQTPDGVKLWCFDTKGDFLSAPMVFNGTIYFGSSDGYVYAFTSAGKQLWHYQTPPNTNPTYFAIADGVVCAIIEDNSNIDYVYGLTASQGTFRWSYVVGESGVPIVSKNVLYVAASNGIYAIALNSGALMWQYSNATQLSLTGLMIHDDTLYFGSYDTYLYALSTDGTLLWRYRTGGTVNIPTIR